MELLNCTTLFLHNLSNRYIEMKDRATDVLKESHSRLEEEHRERELLKKENPLVILDRLKASLRILFALKEDSEMQLKEQISTIKAEIETRLISLKAQMEALVCFFLI